MQTLLVGRIYPSLCSSLYPAKDTKRNLQLNLKQKTGCFGWKAVSPSNTFGLRYTLQEGGFPFLRENSNLDFPVRWVAARLCQCRHRVASQWRCCEKMCSLWCAASCINRCRTVQWKVRYEMEESYATRRVFEQQCNQSELFRCVLCLIFAMDLF